MEMNSKASHSLHMKILEREKIYTLCILIIVLYTFFVEKLTGYSAQ